MTACVTRSQLDQLHAGELAAADSARVRRHLQTCDTCAALDHALVAANERLLPQLHALGRASAIPTRPQSPDPPPSVTADANSQGQSGSAVPDIPGCRNLRELHRGGQGVVFEAYQTSTKRKVAVKIMLAGRFASPRARKRFEREIEIVAQLKHAHIISIFDSGRLADGLQFYVMDYVRGQRLDHHVRDNKLGLAPTLRLFAEICEAVQYAHQCGVIHRDLKPSNIMIDADGRPRILDFGLAKTLTATEDCGVSLSAEVLGTLPYMSPEQARGNQDQIDTRTDIYALGVMLYEVLTGCYPYPVAGTVAEVLRHIIDTPPTPPSRQWDGGSGVCGPPTRRPRHGRCPIDDDVQTIVLKALSKDRERRYQSAGELGRDLRHYVAGEPIDAKRDSGWYILRKKLTRHRGKLATAAAFAVVLVTFGSYAQSVARDRRASARQAVLDREARQLEADREVQVRALIDRAKELHSHRRFFEVVQHCDEALAIDPASYEAMLYKAYGLKEHYFHQTYGFKSPEMLGNIEDACRRAISLRPERWGHRNLLATALYSQDRLQEAAEAALSAAERNPDYHYAWSNLAKIRALEHRFDEAVECFETGIAAYERRMAAEGQRQRHDDGIWRAFGTLLRFMEHEDAGAVLREAAAIDPTDYRNSWLLACLHLTPGRDYDPQKARTLIQVATPLAIAESPEPRFNRSAALVYLRNNDFDKARRYAEAAIRGGDRPAYARLILAIAQARDGDRLAAAGNITLATEHWPDFDEDVGVVVEAEKGLLWFDSAAELESLLEEARDLVGRED